MRKLEFIANGIVQAAKDKKLEKDVLSFFKDNKNPTDEALHKWTEEKGHDVHEVETFIYTLATKYVNFLLDGRANKEGFTEEDADVKQLSMGEKVELEHTTDKDVARRISLDHLSELPDYYTRLKKMEGD